MKYILAFMFLIGSSSVFACDHDQAGMDKGRTVASADAKAGGAHTCGEGHACSHDGKECACNHGKDAKHDKACGCEDCKHKHEGKTKS